MNSTFKNSLGNGKKFWENSNLIGLYPEKRNSHSKSHFDLTYLPNVHLIPYWKYFWGKEKYICRGV